MVLGVYVTTTAKCLQAWCFCTSPEGQLCPPCRPRHTLRLMSALSPSCEFDIVAMCTCSAKFAAAAAAAVEVPLSGSKTGHLCSQRRKTGLRATMERPRPSCAGSIQAYALELLHHVALLNKPTQIDRNLATTQIRHELQGKIAH